MADIPLYEGDTVCLHWGTLQWECQVYCSDERCVMCGGATVQIEPSWETWRLLCCAESALTTTQTQHRAVIDQLEPGAIGMVSSLPVRVEKKGK
jgi:hypothetical protein